MCQLHPCAVRDETLAFSVAPRDPGKSENVLVFARMLSWGTAPFEFLKMHLYQYTQKIELCSNKFDFLPLFCLVGLVPNSLLSGSRGDDAILHSWLVWRVSPFNEVTVIHVR